MPLAKGAKARVVAPVIEGVVDQIKYDEDTGEKKLLLVWPDEDNGIHHRWFKEDELAAVE